MACDANTLEALQYLDRCSGLSERDLLMCRASVLAAGADFPTATDALNAANANGYAKLAERDLEAIYAALLCSLVT